MGCGKKPLIADPKAEKKNPEPTKAVPANIADSIVEKEIRRILEKPEGELTKADLEQVTEIDLGGYRNHRRRPQRGGQAPAAHLA